MIGLPFLQPGDKPPCTENPTIFYDDSYVPASDELDDGAKVTRYNVARAQENEVLAICRDCPFRIPCMEWAIKHEDHGFWAGTSPHQRRKMREAWGVVLETPPTVSDRGIRAERKREAARQRGLLYERELRERSAETIRAYNAVKYGRKDEAS